MKDIKTLLKEAREAIKNKNYELALKLSKQILKEDSGNYMALVFAGVSFQETSQNQKAFNAFQDAIKLNPDNPLAWNGLINYYEKLDSKETNPELIKIYIKLLDVEVVEKKLMEYVHKLSNCFEYGNITEITTALYSLFKSEKNVDKVEIAAAIVNIFSQDKNVSADLLAMYEKALETLVNNQKSVCIKYFTEYLNLLYKLNKKDQLYNYAKKMHNIYESDWISLRWICKIFNETYVETSVLIEEDENIINYSECLLKLENQSATALFTKSIIFEKNNNLTEARDLLCQVVNSLPGLLHAWILLLKCYIKLNLFENAIQAANKTDSLLQSANESKQKLKSIVNVMMMEALSKSEEERDLKRALEIYEKMEERSKSLCLIHLIRTNINLKNFTQALTLMETLEEKGVSYDLLKSELLYKQEKYSEALEILESKDVNLSDWWIQIGRIYWDSQQYEKSLVPYLKAAKIDTTNYKCFLLLGNYYKRINDLDKARRCYEKSFKINVNSAEAGIELSKIYRKMKNWDANLTLLQALTKGVISSKNSWAWMQLGLHYLEKQEYDEAIANLRFVIRVDENNRNCWESLADAYLAKGAYTSALRCYEKASGLSADPLYPMLQKATIKKILGEFQEARSDFESILKVNRLYVPALKEMAETCLLQGKECLEAQRLGTARDHAQCAIDHLIIALDQRNDLSCLWKLLGDSCFLISSLPEKFCCVLAPASFIKENESSGNTVLEKNDLFVLAEKCYYRGLVLSDDNILMWHDLAVCYLKHSRYNDNLQYLEKAQSIARYCTSKNPTHWQHWNLLGNIAMNLNPSNYCLAQHSFIKAVVADSNSAVSWSNLGSLYFILGEFKLANEAYSQAQRADPNYVNSWIGQALIAENLAHEDSMDLFRHSTQLAYHKQGALGYAYWICKTLKEAPLDAVMYSIHNMNAIPVACDVITWYTERNPLDATAWNMLGLLKERMGLKLGSLEAFKNALSLSNGQNRDLARVNYGRSLTRLDNYFQAIEEFSKVKTATFNSASGLALALFKAKQYKESYETYESTLHWLSEEPQYQSDLLVALASMAYMFEGLEAAKILLFQSIQLEKPSPWSFYATLALGLLHSDFNLAELVLTELQRYKHDKSCAQHFALLSGFYYFLQNNNKSAIREVSKVIHRFPNQASVWLTLSSLLIRSKNNKQFSKIGANCAQIALKLGQTDSDVTKVLCLASLSLLDIDKAKDALLMVQKAVHCYPNIAENWAVLVKTLIVTKKTENHYFIKKIVKFMESITIHKDLKKWTEKLSCM